MSQVSKTPCWDHISGSHTTLKPYNLTCWQLPLLHYTYVISWMSILNLVVNGNDFSISTGRHRFLKSHVITLHASYHWHVKCHYEKLEHVIVMIAKIGKVDIERKTISGLNHIMEHQLQIMSFIGEMWFLPEASYGLRVLSLPACVCVSVRQSRACPHDNFSTF